jgi:preprotein translocase subunit YajC
MSTPVLLAMAAPPEGANPIVGLLPMVAILAIFYFIILRPMKRRQQKVQAFIAALKVGDRVVTSGGIYGSITKLGDTSLQLQVADKVRVEVSRNAIIGYQGQEPVAPQDTPGGGLSS